MPRMLNSAMGLRVLAVLAVALGALTVKEGGGVLFGAARARAAAGNYVAFVVWSNFLAGFAYVAAGIGFWLRQRWSVRLAGLILAVTLATFVAFAAHIALDGAYERRTVIAMTMRTLVWGFIFLAAPRVLGGQAP